MRAATAASSADAPPCTLGRAIPGLTPVPSGWIPHTPPMPRDGRQRWAAASKQGGVGKAERHVTAELALVRAQALLSPPHLPGALRLRLRLHAASTDDAVLFAGGSKPRRRVQQAGATVSVGCARCGLSTAAHPV
jgi:hypothetical protein